MAFIYDLTDTWNAGGTTFNAIKMNVTDSASAAASKLITLQVGGAERFGVDKSGIGTFASAVRVAGGSTSAPAFSFSSDTNTGMWSPSSDAIAFSTAGSERMRIAADGTMTLSVGGVSNTHTFNYNESGGEIQLIDSTGAGSILIDNTSGLARFYKVGTGGMAVGTTGTGAFQFLTNNAERMRISSAGNVGIGTSTPTERLDTGTGNTRTQALVISGDQHLIYSGASTELGIRIGTGGPFYGIGTTGSDNMRINSASGGDMLFAIASTERMRINSSGNVGIGTTAPGGRVQITSTSSGNVPATLILANPVANSAGTGADLRFYVNDGGSDRYAAVRSVQTVAGNVADLRFLTSNSDTPTERMRISPNGVVGIGVAGGDASLHIVGIRGGNSRMTQMSTGGTSQNNLNIIASSSAGSADQWFSYGVTASNYYFVQQGVGTGDSGLVVNSNNRVMVGTSTAFDTTVGANFMASGSAGSAAAFRVNATTTTQVSFYDSSQTARVGWIGTASSTTSYNTTSDRRLKQNIQPVADCGDKIDQIEIVSHQWRNGTDVVIPYAVIAQDLYEVAPHAVTKGDDGEEVGLEWGVDYSKLVPMLVKEIQSLRARVAQLEGN